MDIKELNLGHVTSLILSRPAMATLDHSELQNELPNVCVGRVHRGRGTSRVFNEVENRKSWQQLIRDDMNMFFKRRLGATLESYDLAQIFLPSSEQDKSPGVPSVCMGRALCIMIPTQGAS
jgi:hypothetical protein